MLVLLYIQNPPISFIVSFVSIQMSRVEILGFIQVLSGREFNYSLLYFIEYL